MDYSKLSKEELLEEIDELKRLNKQLLMENEKVSSLDYSWTGNLGHWYWDIKNNSVTFNPLKVTTLGYTMEEIPEKIDYTFFTEKLHPDDYKKTMKVMMDHLYGKASVYEAEYRIKTKAGDYKWYYDRGRITQYDENGKPSFLAGIVFDITEKKQMQIDLEKMNVMLTEQNSIDGLTKIKNHRALLEFLEAEISESKLSKKPISITMFDIDDFKKVNDTMGHVYGDMALIKIAEIMKNSLRETDLVGRYGGEEFMLVLNSTNIKEAHAISDRIRKSIEEYNFEENVKITISGGVKEHRGESLSEFIDAADINLYKAKKSGKNKVISS